MIEKEVKHPLTGERDIARIRSELERRFGAPREQALEVSTWYETSTPGGLRRVRLRSGNASTITYKAVVDAADQTKTRIEHEVEVDNLDSARSILEKLGFEETIRYERFRETYSCGKACVCIDRMPFGDFIEIEGELGEIERVEAELGLGRSDRLLERYMDRGRRATEQEGLDPCIITFAAFGMQTPKG